MMAIVKRYPNRKLYDTEAKQYITLEGIAHLIRDGQEVQVIDHATGEDLTTLTLTQIILEQEKKRSGFLPQAVLTGLVQAGGDRLSTLRSALTAPLDLLRQVDDEIEHRIQVLIKKGELAEEEGRRLADKLIKHARRTTAMPADEEALETMLRARGLPSQSDIAALAEQLDTLNKKLAHLSERVQAAEIPEDK
jgi:polyhydroxyalkanoate synthesis repressor PhaR